MVTVTDLVLAQAVFGHPQDPIANRTVGNASNAMRGAALANALDQYPADTDGLASGMEGSSAPVGAPLELRSPDLPRRDVEYGHEVSPMITGLQTEQDPLEQRGVRYLPPPPRPQRPFSADYPLSFFLHPRYLWHPPTDFQGRLRHDPERRALEAKYVAGRRYADQPDIGLQHHEAVDVLKQLGHTPRFLPTNQMPNPNPKAETPAGATGILDNTWPRSWVEGGRFRPGEVSIDANLDPRSERIAVSHELGHVLRLLTRLSMNDDARRELRTLFNTMNNPNRTRDGLDAAPGSTVTPETFGYRNQKPIPGLDRVEEEYFAEAFRAYMTDPNFLKSVAPNLAAAIRDAVNSHPRLRPVIQFNSLKYPRYAELGQNSDQADLSRASRNNSLLSIRE